MKNKVTNTYNTHKIDVALFAISGILAFLVDITTLQLVDKITGSLLVATTLGIAAGFAVSFTLNQLRFRHRHVNTRKLSESFILFFVLFMFNSGFTFWCLKFNENHANYPRVLVKAGTVSCIMVWNYMLFHLIVFRKKSNETDTI